MFGTEQENWTEVDCVGRANEIVEKVDEDREGEVRKVNLSDERIHSLLHEGIDEKHL